jgi:hypothetical protein
MNQRIASKGIWTRFSNLRFSAFARRFAFHPGYLVTETDPGDGSFPVGSDTDFPFEVTLYQIYSLFFRIKSGRFSQGGVNYVTEVVSPPGSPLGEEEIESSVEIFDGDLPATLASEYFYDTEGIVFIERGDNFFIDDPDNYQENLLYGELYEVGNNEDKYYADAIDHRVNLLGLISNNNGVNFRLQASCANDDNPSPLYGITSTNSSGSGIEVILTVQNQIACIGTPFSQGTRYFLKAEFSVISGIRLSTKQFSGSSASSKKMRINTGTSFCEADLFVAPFDSGVISGDASDNFVFEPSEWWPYATTTGDPAWDEESGEPINGGPGA